MKLKKVISGGQTGIDRIGIQVTFKLGIETGGIAPRTFRTEDGFDESLRKFNLIEHKSHKYPPRTNKC